MVRSSIIGFMFIVTILVGWGNVSAATNVSSCGTLSTAGVYKLTTDISSSSTCIRIESSDVVFDGAGYSITGPGYSYGIYVYKSGTTLTNVTVRNVTVTDWEDGIYYNNTENGSITNNTASGNVEYGIYLRSSSTNTLTNNTALNNYYGIYLESSSNYNTLTNNTVNSNYDVGIVLYSSSNYNTLTNNTVNSNGLFEITAGIYLFSSSNYNTISNNTVNSNYGDGISLGFSSSNTITGNNASNNDYGIHLYSSSNNNLISNNFLANTNNAYDYGVNFWNTTKAAGTNIVGGPYLGGNYWAKPDGTGFSENCTDADSDGICDSNYTLASGNVDYLPLSLSFTAGTTPPTITIYSPTNTTITATTPDLNFTIRELANTIYNWDGEGNITGCQNCTSYSTTYGEYANTSDQNLVGLWHLNENIGSTATDDSANGNDGTITGAAWTTGTFGNALSFDGVDDYVGVPDTPELRFTIGTPLTLEAWVKINTLKTNPIIIKPDETSSTEGYQFLVKSDGKLFFGIGGWGLGWNMYVFSTNTVPVNQWTHVAVVYSGSDIADLYINGQLETPSSTYDTGSAYYPVGTTPLLIGRGRGHYFNGTIDEVAIWNRTLSADEIAEIYNKSLLDGQHNVTVYANDSAGDVINKTQYFTVQARLPYPTTILYTGVRSMGIDADYTNHKVFVAGLSSSKVVVIDGLNHTVLANISVNDSTTHGIAVDQSTHFVFTADAGSNSSTIIDGNTNTLYNITPLMGLGHEVAINPFTHRVYITNQNNDKVSIIDGDPTSSVFGQVIDTISVGWKPAGIAINPNTNGKNGTIYVVHTGDYTVWAINGTGNTLIKIINLTNDNDPSTLDFPHMLTYLESLNRVYANHFNGLVEAIDCTDNTLINDSIDLSAIYNQSLVENNLSYLKTVKIGSNNYTKHVYVTHKELDVISVIDGNDLSFVGSVSTGGLPVAVTADPVLNQVYVSGMDDTMTIIYYGYNATPGNETSISINIDSPSNTTIADNTPDLNITVNKTVDITYNWNGEGNISGCRNCTSYNTTYGENNGSDTNLTALWHINENTGTVIYDDSSNINDGTLIDGNTSNSDGDTPPQWVSGKFGKALSFDGADDYVDVGENGLYISTFTIMAWVRPIQSKTQTVWSIFLDDYCDVVCVASGYYWGLNANNNITFSYGDGGGQNTYTETSTDPVNINEWTQVSLVVSGTNLKIYLNGMLDSNRTLNNDAFYEPQGWEDAQIGRYFNTYDGSSGNYFNGTIDEVAIFNRTLSADEIHGLYSKHLEDGQHNVTVYANDTAGNMNSSTRWFSVGIDTTLPQITIHSPPNATINDSTPDLNLTTDESSYITYTWDSEGNITGCKNCTSYSTTYGEYTNSSNQNLSLALHLNENAGYLAHDDSGNGNDGTLTGPIWAPGRFASGLDFSKDEYITIPHSDSLAFNDSFSISFWITFKEDNRGQWIISKLNTTPTWTGFHIGRSSNNKLIFMVHHTSYGTYSNLAYPVSNNTWYHVVLIRDKDNQQLRLYLNSTFVENATDSTTGVSVNTAEQVVIGANYSFENRLNATLDEVLIFNRALGETEISKLFNKTLSEGQHNVTVYANDTAGNINSSSVRFTIDSIPPTINITSPENKTYSTDSVDLNISTDEPARITYTFDGEGNITGCQNCTSYSTTYGENNGSDTNLTALWHMNENTGTTVYDDASNSNDGTLVGGASWAAGKFAHGLKLNGVNGYVSVPYSSSMDVLDGNKPFTFGMWFKPDKLPNASNLHYSLFAQTNGTGMGRVWIFLPKSAASCYSENEIASYLGGTFLCSDVIAEVGTWYFTVISYNGTHSTIYVNGEAKNTTTITVDEDADGDYKIGTSKRATTFWFNGTIDEIMFFDRRLSDAEVQALYNKTLSEGQHNVRVYANDTAGNMNSSTVYFTVDTNPPEIIITSPQNITYNTSSVDLNYSIADASGIDWVGYSLDGLANVKTSGEITTFSNSAGGDLGTATNVTFTSAGSNTSAYIKVPKNATVYSANMNVSGHYYSQLPIESSGNVSPPITPTEVDVNLLNTDGSNIDVNLLLTICYLDGGLNTDCINSVDNSSIIWWSIYLGKSNLYVMVEAKNGTDINITVEEYELLTIIAVEDGYVTGDYYLSRAYPSNLSIDTANDTYVDWSITGELNSANSPQTVDLNITAINNYINTCNADEGGNCLVPLNISSDSAGTVQLDALTVKYYSNGTLTSLSDGEHNVTVYANDTAGNMNPSTVWFSIDTTPPTYSNLTPRNNSYTNYSRQDISIVITDTGSDVNAGSLSMTVAGNYYDTNSGKLSYDTNSGLLTYYAEDGEFTGGQVVYVVVNAEDNVGNQMEVTWSFTVTITGYNISLIKGWNLISIPLEQSNWSIDAVLASIEGNYTVVYSWTNDCIWKKSTSARNSLTNMSLEYGYWIDMTASDTLELIGTVPTSTTINVTNACWNLVGYPSLTTRNLTTVLSPINYSVVYAYINESWKKSTAARNPLTEMSPGYGYWIHANEAGSYEVVN